MIYQPSNRAILSNVSDTKQGNPRKVHTMDPVKSRNRSRFDMEAKRWRNFTDVVTSALAMAAERRKLESQREKLQVEKVKTWKAKLQLVENRLGA